MEKKKIQQTALSSLNDSIQQQIPAEQTTDRTDENSTGLNWPLSLNRAPYSDKYEQGTQQLQGELLETPVLVYVQPWAPQKDIFVLINQVKSMPAKAILFADFVNPVMAEKLRQRGVWFADCVGNLYIKNHRLNCFVKGKKQSQLRSKRVRGRAFNAAGLKLIFALFNEPRFLHAPYRDISNKINIALGSVGPVIDDLYSSGYILDDGDRRLVNKRRLFERWVDGYLEKLRPRQILGCYTSDDNQWWKKADPSEFKGLWGGEVIIARSTPYMEPETISLYFSSDRKQHQFAEHYGLRSDMDGEICTYKNFWSPSYAGDDNDDGISPMIVYADIVDSINPGSWDVAKTFYGEAVAHLLRD